MHGPREREREVDTIRVHNRSDVTGEIDRPPWTTRMERERDTRVLGPRTRNSPEMTVPRALFRQSAARFIANFRASITETMAANRCPCIPPCTSVRHRDSIESWSSIKLESSPPNNSYGGFVPITSLSTGKTLLPNFLRFPKKPSYFSLFFYPPSLCFFVFSRNGSFFSSLLPSFSSRVATALAFVSYSRSFAWKIVLLFRRKKRLFSRSLCREVSPAREE